LSLTIAITTPSQNTPGLAEHAAHCDAAERGQLVTQELGKAVARDHQRVLGNPGARPGDDTVGYALFSTLTPAFPVPRSGAAVFPPASGKRRRPRPPAPHRPKGRFIDLWLLNSGIHSSEFPGSVNDGVMVWRQTAAQRDIAPSATTTCASPEGGLCMNWLFRHRNEGGVLASFVADDGGATAIEYGLIAALISVVIIGVLTTTGTNLTSAFTSVSNALGSN